MSQNKSQTLYRLFIAVEFPPPIKEALTHIQTQLKTAPGVRWTKPSQLHLTLQFLGNTPMSKVSSLIQVLQKIAVNTKPFKLYLGQPGLFPNAKRPRIVWVGLAGETEALLQLQQRVVVATGSLGFQAEDRPFKPHITLGRSQKQAMPASLVQLGRMVKQQTVRSKAMISADHLSLIRSQLRPSGPIYTTLAEIMLKSE